MRPTSIQGRVISNLVVPLRPVGCSKTSSRPTALATLVTYGQTFRAQVRSNALFSSRMHLVSGPQCPPIGSWYRFVKRPQVVHLAAALDSVGPAPLIQLLLHAKSTTHERVAGKLNMMGQRTRRILTLATDETR